MVTHNIERATAAASAQRSVRNSSTRIWADGMSSSTTVCIGLTVSAKHTAQLEKGAPESQADHIPGLRAAASPNGIRHNCLYRRAAQAGRSRVRAIGERQNRGRVAVGSAAVRSCARRSAFNLERRTIKQYSNQSLA